MANFGLKAMYTGRDAILGAFNDVRGDNPYYSIWYGGQMLSQYSGIDMDEGYNRLSGILEAAEQNGNTDILVIKLHPKPKGDYITNKSEVIGTMPVRVVDFDSGTETLSGTSTGLLATPVYNMFKDIRTHMVNDAERMQTLEVKIAGLEAAQIVEPVEKDWIEKASDILQKPGVSDFLLKLVTMLPISGIGQPQPNIQMNGVNDVVKEPVKSNPVNEDVKPEVVFLSEADDVVIDEALERLSVHCNIVEVLPKLAAFAENDPQTFKWLLGQLK